MIITQECSRCGHLLPFPEEDVGETKKCVYCGVDVVVQEPAQADPSASPEETQAPVSEDTGEETGTTGSPDVQVPEVPEGGLLKG